MDYFQQQNLIFFDFINDLFELKKHRTWNDLAKSITELKMKLTYRKFADLFPRKINYQSELEKLPAGFKTIHYAKLKGTTIIDEVVRFSLYSDTIIVFHPLQNPAITNQTMNPGRNPKLWLPDFINSLYFYVVIQKWVRAGIVQLIVNPVDYDKKWYDDIIAQATQRVALMDLDNPVLLEETMEEMAEQFANSLKKNETEEEIVKWLLSLKTPIYSKDQAEAFAKKIKEAIPKVNPIFDSIPRTLIANQISPTKGGGPLESILEIAELTGGNIYTPSKFHWHNLQQIKKNELWVKLSHIYSKVDLTFLNNVSTEFALNIRQEGRLIGVRTELKKIFSELNNIDIDKITENKISYLYEGFVDEIRKAESDWNAIKRESEITKQQFALSALAIPIMITQPMSILPIAMAAGSLILGNIRTTTVKKDTFRIKNPVSVFVDSQQKQGGFFSNLKSCVF
jgi:hypothetical protein